MTYKTPEELKCQKAILSTLGYFSIFEYPLTAFEIWHYLYNDGNERNRFSLEQVLICLESISDQLISKNDEFYFLNGRESDIQTRKRRYKIAIKKYNKAKKIFKILSYFPYVRMIAVCNSLPIMNSKENSDIDMFIVCSKNKIWTARFFIAAFLKLTRLRPTKKVQKDKICPSFFISEQDLNLEKIKINKQDIYLKYWIATLMPIYIEDSLAQAFFASNRWVKNSIQNMMVNIIVSDYEIKHSFFTTSIKNIKEAFLSPLFIERILRFLQRLLLPKNLKQIANTDSRVVINNKILKFHDKDRRGEYGERFYKTINQYSRG